MARISNHQAFEGPSQLSYLSDSVELQFVRSLWIVYLADQYFTVLPTKFKKVFYRQNTLEGKWNTFKGKGGETKKKNKTQRQKCQTFDSPAIDSSFHTMTSYSMGYSPICKNFV